MGYDKLILTKRHRQIIVDRFKSTKHKGTKVFLFFFLFDTILSRNRYKCLCVTQHDLIVVAYAHAITPKPFRLRSKGNLHLIDERTRSLHLSKDRPRFTVFHPTADTKLQAQIPDVFGKIYTCNSNRFVRSRYHSLRYNKYRVGVGGGGGYFFRIIS